MLNQYLYIRWHLLKSDTRTIGKVPDTAGVPCKSPAVLKVKPAGKALDVLKVYGAVPLADVNDLLKGNNCVPVAGEGLLTVMVGHDTVKEPVALPTHPTRFTV